MNGDTVDGLFYKYLGFDTDSSGRGIKAYIQALHFAEDESVRRLLAELIRETPSIRHSADTPSIFDAAWRELERWLLHEGWAIENGQLVRLIAGAEESTGLRDKLAEELQASALDSDGLIVACIQDAAKMFVAEPPDYNSSVTKIRIALETIGRRAAAALATSGKGDYSEDSWGKALEFLRKAGVLTVNEEEVLARIYTFISEGAHVPTGITHEEWARLARTFGLGACYFLFKKHIAATG